MHMRTLIGVFISHLHWKRSSIGRDGRFDRSIVELGVLHLLLAVVYLTVVVETYTQQMHPCYSYSRWYVSAI